MKILLIIKAWLSHIIVHSPPALPHPWNSALHQTWWWGQLQQLRTTSINLDDGKGERTARGIWGAQSVKRPTSAQVTVSRFRDLSPVLGELEPPLWALHGVEPLWDYPSLSLSLPLAHSCPPSQRETKVSDDQAVTCFGAGTRLTISA